MLSAEGCVGWGGGKQNYYGSIWNVPVAQIQVWNPYLLEFGGERTQNLAASIMPRSRVAPRATGFGEGGYII